MVRAAPYFLTHGVVAISKGSHAGSKTLLQQNPPVLNWECLLTQVVLYNGRKMVLVVLVIVVIVVVVILAVVVIVGSRPSDHYFRSVCLFVCLFVCLCSVFLSRL